MHFSREVQQINKSLLSFCQRLTGSETSEHAYSLKQTLSAGAAWIYLINVHPHIQTNHQLVLCFCDSLGFMNQNKDYWEFVHLRYTISNWVTSSACVSVWKRCCIMCESPQPELWDLEQLQMSEETLCLSRFTRPASPSKTEGSACYWKIVYIK